MNHKWWPCAGSRATGTPRRGTTGPGYPINAGAGLGNVAGKNLDPKKQYRCGAAPLPFCPAK